MKLRLIGDPHMGRLPAEHPEQGLLEFRVVRVGSGFHEIRADAVAGLLSARNGTCAAGFESVVGDGSRMDRGSSGQSQGSGDDFRKRLGSVA